MNSSFLTLMRLKWDGVLALFDRYVFKMDKWTRCERGDEIWTQMWETDMDMNSYTDTNRNALKI